MALSFANPAEPARANARRSLRDLGWALLLLRILRRRILRVLLGIRRIRSGLLAERTLPRWLTDGLTYRLSQASSRLHSRLAHTKRILRRIPDELEEAVILCLIVDNHRFLVDLAADSNNVSAHDGWGVTGGNWGVGVYSRPLVGGYVSSGCPWGILGARSTASHPRSGSARWRSHLCSNLPKRRSEERRVGKECRSGCGA